MRLTCDRDTDSAYVEFAVWKGTDGWSNMALLASDDLERGETVTAHFMFSIRNELQAIQIKDASRWMSAAVLEQAEPFEPWDGVERDEGDQTVWP